MCQVKDATGTREELGPDHIFYFTIRDSANFEDEEHFGLVESLDVAKRALRIPKHLLT